MAEKTLPQTRVAVMHDGELGQYKPPMTYAKLREMRKDPTIALARTLVMAPVLASEWSVEETEKAPEGAKAFINEQMIPVRMHILRTAMAGWIDYGWMPYEKIFKIDAQGKAVIKKIKPLIQDFTRIMVEPKTGAYTGLKQDDVELSVQETLLLSFDVEGTDWYGRALIRNAEEPYDDWRTINKAATKYDAKIAGSHWVIKYPMGVSVIDGTEMDNFELAKKFLQALSSSGSIAVPKWINRIMEDIDEDAEDAWDISLISDSSNARSNFTERQKYLDALKVRAFGMPERAILEGQFGTKAEAEAHADFAIVNMDVRHQQVVQDVNWHVVNQLLKFNYGDGFDNTVYLKAAPIADMTISYLKKVYEKILSSPEGFLIESESIDSEALKDRLGIPVMPVLDVDATGFVHEDSASDITSEAT